MTIEALHKRLDKVKTPAYVLDEEALIRNLKTVDEIRARAGVKILLATKAFAMFQAFPLMRPYLDGTTASGYNEARLGHEEFGKEVHVYSPAFNDAEIEKLMPIVSHISFNSAGQFQKYHAAIKRKHPDISLGLRINPELCLTHKKGYDKYNPCAPRSRMGALRQAIDLSTLSKLEGLHFHVLCEHTAKGSIKLIDCVEENFGDWVRKVKWVNFGGGHFINEPGYGVSKLIARLKAFRKTFPDQEIILEPGGGIVYDTGYLVATVLDIVENEKKIAILDTSATTHMPDILLASIRAPLYGADEPNKKKHNYILGGGTCMCGDVIGEYSFDKPLKVGQKLIFGDVMQYSFVQSTTFNGMPLPDLAVLRQDGRYDVLQSFGYEDFKHRLGGTTKIRAPRRG